MARVSFMSRIRACIASMALCMSFHAQAQSAYHPIVATMANQTVLLTGHDLTIEQAVRIARHGAKVALSPAALRTQSDAYGLLLEASSVSRNRPLAGRSGIAPIDPHQQTGLRLSRDHPRLCVLPGSREGYRRRKLRQPMISRHARCRASDVPFFAQPRKSAH